VLVDASLNDPAGDGASGLRGTRLPLQHLSVFSKTWTISQKHDGHHPRPDALLPIGWSGTRPDGVSHVAIGNASARRRLLMLFECSQFVHFGGPLSLED